MTIPRSAAILCVVAATLIAVPAAFGESAEATYSIQKMNVMDRTSPPPFQPARQDVTFADSGPEVPAGLTDAHRGTTPVAGGKLALVMGKSAEAAAGPDVLYVDGNGDGKFGEDEKYPMTPRNQNLRDGSTVVMGNNLDVTVKAGDQALPFIYAYSIHNGETKAQMIAIYYGAAKVKVGDTEYAVDMMDGDSDGNFGGAKDGWTLRPAAEPVKRPESEYGMTVGKEKRFADGKLFTLAVGKGKVTLTWSAAEGPDPATLASQRERAEKAWAERFAPEKEGFVKARGMDTSRPLAETPIHWNYVTLAKAKAMAKKADKPLFVDVMAFWCVWCYRMDFYTYPDKAVADLLNNDFIPVKIIQEQDQAGDYSTLMKELGARGIPAMGIWSADGDLVKYISGWSKPSDFETTLKTALEKAKAPKEEAGEKDGESGDSK